MSAPLARAILVPFSLKNDGTIQEGSDEIWLDFNPESLKLTYPALTETSGAQGCSETQTRRIEPATLSFSAIFDTTRPPHLGQGGVSFSASLSLGGGGPDVREKTKLLRALLGRETESKLNRALFGKDVERNPNTGYQYVQFRWGSVLFSGLLQGFTETLDLFAADGTPLRARVDLTIKEHIGKNEIVGESVPEDRVSWSKQKSIGSNPSLGLSPGMSLGLGGGMSLGFSAGAGVGLSVGASVGVFGSAALSAAFGASVDLSLSVSGLPRPDASAADTPGSTPTSWAPAGPAAGSAAAADATAVAVARAEGRALADPAEALLVATRAGPAGPTGAVGPGGSSTGPPDKTNKSSILNAADPLPITGSPPRRHPPVQATAPRPIYAAPAVSSNPAGRPLGRPSWEGPSREEPGACPGRGRRGW